MTLDSGIEIRTGTLHARVMMMNVLQRRSPTIVRLRLSCLNDATEKAPPNGGAFSERDAAENLEGYSELSLNCTGASLAYDRSERSNRNIGVRNANLRVVQYVGGINPQRKLLGFRDPEGLLRIGIETERSPTCQSTRPERAKLSRFGIDKQIHYC